LLCCSLKKLALFFWEALPGLLLILHRPGDTCDLKNVTDASNFVPMLSVAIH
jgi:hypothetical protein